MEDAQRIPINPHIALAETNRKAEADNEYCRNRTWALAQQVHDLTATVEAQAKLIEEQRAALLEYADQIDVIDDVDEQVIVEPELEING